MCKSKILLRPSISFIVYIMRRLSKSAEFCVTLHSVVKWPINFIVVIFNLQMNLKLPIKYFFESQYKSKRKFMSPDQRGTLNY